MRPLLALVLLAGCATDPAPAPAPPSEPLAPDADPPQAVAAAPEADTSWTVGITDLPGEKRDVLVRSARLASHPDATPGYDRLVFEFDGGLPEVHVEYVDRPVHACGSGEALTPEGDGFLEIRLTGARAHTDAGEATIPHGRQRRGLPTVLETVPTCDFEGVVTWVLGVASPEAYRVVRLEAPSRLAVDVQHAP